MSLLFSYFRLQLLSFSFLARVHVSLIHSSLISKYASTSSPMKPQFPRINMCELQHHMEQSSLLHRCGGQVVRRQSCKSRNIGSMPSHAFSCTTLNILRDMYIKTEGIQPICSTLFPLIYNSFFTAYTKSETGMNQTCFGVMELSMGPCGWFPCK